MAQNVKNYKALLGVTAAFALMAAGAAYAGGEDCKHEKNDVVAAHDHGAKDHAAGCALAKNVTKSAKMTDDGAVVMLEGKTDEAVKMLKSHLAEHKESGEGCEGCPMGQEGVTAKISMTDKGGELTLSGSSPEAIKSVQEWAKKPAGACCAGMEKKS